MAASVHDKKATEDKIRAWSKANEERKAKQEAERDQQALLEIERSRKAVESRTLIEETKAKSKATRVAYDETGPSKTTFLNAMHQNE